jgi:proteasome component ECM29
MDDIKESVRLAAGKAVAALSRTSIRMCDSSQSGSKASQEAIEAILPPILNQGLGSSVTEVRSVSLNLVVKITKSAGPLLKSHLHQLIPALLEATSEMESKDVSYLSTRLANDANIQEMLDSARIAAAKSSPMMECVNYVLQFVDGDTLTLLVPKLIDLLKSSVGLGTKGTAAHVVVSLTHQCPHDLQAFTGKILSAFVSGLGDRNPAVRKTYASAIGHLMKTAKDNSVEKLFFKLRTW